MKSYIWWKRQKKRVQKKYTLLAGMYLSPKEMKKFIKSISYWFEDDEDDLR